MKLKDNLTIVIATVASITVLLEIGCLLAFAYFQGVFSSQNLVSENYLLMSAIAASITLLSMLLTLALVRHKLSQLFEQPFNHFLQTIRRIEKGETSDFRHSNPQCEEMLTCIKSLEDMRRQLDINHKSMEKLAYYDKLTGLPNRESLTQTLKMTINAAKRKDEHFAVLFLDLDEFKSINDTLGHEVGDLLLAEVSQRIQSLLRESDFVVRKDLDTSKRNPNLVARLAGDEFTILITEILAPSMVSKVAKRILDALTDPFTLHQHEVQIGASIGISIYPQDGETAEELLKNADFAMFEAKHGGKNRFEFFTKEMNQQAKKRLEMERSLKLALENNEFTLYYHPRITSQGDKIAGFEALIRWESPERGLVSPAEFLSVAEETVLICEIGYWVIKQVCQFIAECHTHGHEDVSVSINLSRMQIYRGDTHEVLASLLKLFNIPGESIEIEVAESGILKDEKVAIEFLKKLKTLGVSLSLDDFGIGYTSISLLQKLPLDVLKIDRSFVNYDDSGDKTKQLFKSVIDIAKNFNLETVASGVEHEHQLQFVRSTECDYVQGYYFSKPLPQDKALDFLTDWPQRQAEPSISQAQ